MLSIIVPVYNVEKYLDKCLSTIEKQTSKNFEAIIVNDGSTDNSESIILRYCNKNNNFYYYKKENGGLMSAYLLGIEKASGDYIGFVDSDDYVDFKFVEKMYDCNIENADIVICERNDIFENGDLKNNNESPFVSPGLYKENNCLDIYKKILPPFSGKHISNARWNKIFKIEIVVKNLKYLESKSRIMEDRFFTPSCMFSATSFKFIGSKLYFYRQRESGSNHSLASPNLYNAIKLLMNTQKQMLIDKKIYNVFEYQYESACLNYLSLYIERNLLIKESFKTRLHYSKLVVKDKDFKVFVKKHKSELKHKKGLAIKISYFFNSATLLSFFSLLSTKQ